MTAIQCSHAEKVIPLLHQSSLKENRGTTWPLVWFWSFWTRGNQRSTTALFSQAWLVWHKTETLLMFQCSCYHIPLTCGHICICLFAALMALKHQHFLLLTSVPKWRHCVWYWGFLFIIRYAPIVTFLKVSPANNDFYQFQIYFNEL